MGIGGWLVGEMVAVCGGLGGTVGCGVCWWGLAVEFTVEFTVIEIRKNVDQAVMTHTSMSLDASSVTPMQLPGDEHRAWGWGIRC